MKPTVILNEEMLRHFGACSGLRDRFVATHPDGFDIGGLWGTDEEAALVWAVLFASEWKRQIGRAIGAGLLPARVRADLYGADLYGADLSGANLRKADLYGANLYEADLSGANLREANLSGADLYGADLRGANLRDADLREADLREADLGGAAWNEYTIWPDGLVPSDVC